MKKTNGLGTKIKEVVIPSLDDLAEVMAPPYGGEALARYNETKIPVEEGGSTKKCEKTSSTVTTDSRGSVRDTKDPGIVSSLDELAEVMAPEYSGEALAPITNGSSLKMEINIDPVNKIFAEVMRIMCNVGLAIILFSAALYFTGVNPSDNLNMEVMKWSEPATKFWKDVKGIGVHGYTWFLSSFTDPENGVVIGTSILALTPLIGFVLTIPRTKGTLRLLFIVITIEFLYAIIRPLIMNIGGAG
ncbi:hypothetical protein [Archaeoglobus veneficus]|uniref:Uncharacterized protein n=1 Tax=Archaeoglobus veneficus (strain DSM 11195 / SNP6) TaxID=693661 RepID=F2KPJ2_ARCVS|nr:hypothetical protein [Archaeoglobus veneficus]AEA46423.1 hypothetical protein Arcve_0390 [Archaeoglobus veneficus SNP6]